MAALVLAGMTRVSAPPTAASSRRAAGSRRSLAVAAASPTSSSTATQVEAAGAGDAAFFLDDAQIRAMTEGSRWSEAELTGKAKDFIRSGFSAGMMADSFEFMGPVVGPLSKGAFTAAFGSFRVEDAFPDLAQNCHHFRQDPFAPDRVWYTSAARAPHTGKSTLAGEPTGRVVEATPQTCSLTFDGEGMVTKFTIGYPMDRSVGNTGGLGGLYGLLYAVGRGLPFPEAQPFQPTLRYKLFQWIGQLAAGMGPKKSDS